MPKLQERREFMNKLNWLLTILGTVGAAVSSLFGGWDTGMTTLVIFMAVDYLTGLVVAGVFQRSTKSDTGALQSKAGWKGLCKKGMTLLIVLIAARLDLVVGSDFIRDATVIAFITNETISIVENAGLMGLPIPAVITNAIDVLKKSGKEDDKNV
jgi:toxin secretion/phage lysis holin